MKVLSQFNSQTEHIPSRVVRGPILDIRYCLREIEYLAILVEGSGAPIATWTEALSSGTPSGESLKKDVLLKKSSFTRVGHCFLRC